MGRLGRALGRHLGRSFGRPGGRGLKRAKFQGIRFRLGMAMALALAPFLVLIALQVDADLREQAEERRVDLQLAAERSWAHFWSGWTAIQRSCATPLLVRWSAAPANCAA